MTLIGFLNGARRLLAVAVLAALLLPVVTVKGCQKDAPEVTYSGVEVVRAAPLLVSIPLYAIVAAALTLLTGRPRTAVGRLILALLKIVWAGAAGVWTAVFFSTIPESDGGKRAETGLWLVLAAALGILACDVVEAALRWSEWRRWRRAVDLPPAADRTVRRIGWGGAIVAGVLALLVVAGNSVIRAQNDLWLGGEVELVMDAGCILLAGWWAAAHVAGWGIGRGLRWGLVLQRAGAAGALGLQALIYISVVSGMTDHFTRWPLEWPGPWTWVVLGVVALWMVWTVWSLVALLGQRRKLFRPQAVVLGG